jgi:hypothetical protein
MIKSPTSGCGSSVAGHARGGDFGISGALARFLGIGDWHRFFVPSRSSDGASLSARRSGLGDRGIGR